MTPEETFDFHIRWAWHKIARIYNARATGYGKDFTMSMGYMLLNIDPEEGTLSTKLGPKMGMEPTSLTRMISSMEEKGLIKRVPDPGDKRKVWIVMTEMGQEGRNVARQTVREFNEKLNKKLSTKEKTDFFHTIQKINSILDNENIFDHEGETEH